MYSISAKVLRKMSAFVPEVVPLPLVLEVLEAVQQAEQAEVHRAHVQARELRLEGRGGAHALLDRHRGGAAGGDVDHAAGALLDDREEAAEGLRRLVRPAVVGIARVQVDDRGPGLGGAHRGVGDLLGRHRQVRRHRRRVDGARHGAGDDDLAALGHGSAPPQSPISRFACRLCRASAMSRRSRQRWRSASCPPAAARDAAAPPSRAPARSSRRGAACSGAAARRCPGSGGRSRPRRRGR